MFVYIMVAKPYMKIGISRNVKERIKGVQTGCPTRITRCIYFDAHTSGSAERIEGLLHERYAACNTWGEWFVYSTDRVRAILALFPEAEELDIPVIVKDNSAQFGEYKSLIFDCYKRQSLGELRALANEIKHITNKAVRRKLQFKLNKYIKKLSIRQRR